jgi:prepilin-type N-terminal cleavage/methylation domain-containing protein
MYHSTATFCFRSLVPNAPGGTRRPAGFTLVELLVVLGIIAILAAIASPLVPALLRGNQMDSSINTLSGILEEAHEAATAGNTYVWVAFTSPVSSSNSPAASTWVATLQSLDGTETVSPTLTTTTPFTATSPAFSIPSSVYTNIAIHGKLQNLPGIQLVKLSQLPSVLSSGSNVNIPAAAYDLVASQGSLGWTTTSLASAGLASTVSFKYAIEFTPNGEAHVPTWSANTQFGIIPTVGPSTVTNGALFNVSRLTGKTTVFRM